MNTLVSPKPAYGKSVRLEKEKFFVVLEDDREIGVPYRWFPRLANVTTEQRQNWRFIGNGQGIHWEDIDEDISILALLYPKEDHSTPSTTNQV
jgi:hypothetical protein